MNIEDILEKIKEIEIEEIDLFAEIKHELQERLIKQYLQGEEYSNVIKMIMSFPP